MKIAIIGAGVSGLSAAWALRNRRNVTLFESAARLGGHSATVDIDYDGVKIAVDTGFIVYNTHNYPNLTQFFAHLGIETYASDMSFGVSRGEGREWSSVGIGGVFAWRRNLLNPAFLGMLGDVARFNAQARSDLRSGKVDGKTLGIYLEGLGVSDRFRRDYILPMGAAIWSTPEDDILDFPAASFLRFFDNHRLMHIDRPIWRSVVGGSRSYVAAIGAALGARAKVDHPVVRARFEPQGGATLFGKDGEIGYYDAVVFACHSDQALGMIENAPADLRAALHGIRFAENDVVLHRDARLMPLRRSAWASWNIAANPTGAVTVSYWMNLLQNIDRAYPLFVTLNPVDPIEETKIFGRYRYAHPQFDKAALAGQAQLSALQGRGGIHFAGAWLGFGFHEDGLKSGLRAALALGGEIPWQFDDAPLQSQRWRALERGEVLHDGA